MRIVIKIGTSTLAHAGGRLNIRHTEELVKTFSDLKNAGHEIILVSSGAIGMGAGKLQIDRPTDMPTKQAAASVGQCELMYTYDRLFTAYNHTVGQILVTREDFNTPTRLMNLENTIYRLLQLGAIPIINENDSVATEEIAVGDNDTMGALVAKYMQADLLVLLSDIEGLYTADPHTHPDAELISNVPFLFRSLPRARRFPLCRCVLLGQLLRPHRLLFPVGCVFQLLLLALLLRLSLQRRGKQAQSHLHIAGGHVPFPAGHGQPSHTHTGAPSRQLSLCRKPDAQHIPRFWLRAPVKQDKLPAVRVIKHALPAAQRLKVLLRGQLKDLLLIFQSPFDHIDAGPFFQGEQELRLLPRLDRRTASLQSQGHPLRFR